MYVYIHVFIPLSNPQFHAVVVAMATSSKLYCGCVLGEVWGVCVGVGEGANGLVNSWEVLLKSSVVLSLF